MTNPNRIDSLDILRGIAMCGILFANVHVFSGYIVASPETIAAVDRWGTDAAVHALERIFLDGKFYSIFSLLFGVGLSVQLRASSAQDPGFVPRYRRRLKVLAAIGFAHMTLLWAGDILFLYAILGFALFALRDRDDQTLTRWIFILLASPIAWYALLWVARVPDILGGPPPDPNATGPSLMDTVRTTMATGNYFEVQKANIVWIVGRWVDLVITARFPKVLGMFVLGLLLERRGIFRAPEQHSALISRTLWIGLVGGIALNGLVAWLAPQGPMLPGSPLGLLKVTASAIGTPLLALGYVALVIRMLDHSFTAALLTPFRAVGRTALSNYLTQSLVCAFLFYGYGFGWFGAVGLTEGMLIALAVVAVLIPLSNLWVRGFAFGPVEWFWRQATYKKRLPIRRGAEERTS
ncbi:MAG: DUF418 domain-containing protein [Rhodanobacteraceae bacterium]|nr:DUF418 domain-containing protein [Rhodanobacteraceae bacterium]